MKVLSEKDTFCKKWMKHWPNWKLPKPSLSLMQHQAFGRYQCIRTQCYWQHPSHLKGNIVSRGFRISSAPFSEKDLPAHWWHRWILCHADGILVTGKDRTEHKRFARCCRNAERWGLPWNRQCQSVLTEFLLLDINSQGTWADTDKIK